MNNEQDTSEEKSDSELIDEVLEQVDNSEINKNKVEEANEKIEVSDVSEELSSVNAEEPKEKVSLVELQKQLKQAEKKAAENWDKALRIQAEMENLKRRTQKDLENAHKYGLERFAKELLSVIDSLELGIQASTSDNPEVKALREGSELTIKQFEAVFGKFNIEAINPSGQPFNPELHQAMTMLPSVDVESNTVIEVFQKGYILNGRLIRPAMVVVSQPSNSSGEPSGPQSDKPEDGSINLDEQA